jgi:hypothetical protein
MVLESDRLPSIVQDVMKRSNILQNLVEITKLRILQDIDDRIIDQQGNLSASFQLGLCLRDNSSQLARRRKDDSPNSVP